MRSRGKADLAASAVERTTASTAKGRAGQRAWVGSVRALSVLDRDTATKYLDLAAGNKTAATKASAKAVRQQSIVDRLDREAQRDLGLPKDD